MDVEYYPEDLEVDLADFLCSVGLSSDYRTRYGVSGAQFGGEDFH